MFASPDYQLFLDNKSKVNNLYSSSSYGKDLGKGNVASKKYVKTLPVFKASSDDIEYFQDQKAA
jgi:hypothetical protein